MARNIILKDSGTHFDPDVVDAFLAVEAQFIEIRNALVESDSVKSRSSSLVGAH